MIRGNSFNDDATTKKKIPRIKETVIACVVALLIGNALPSFHGLFLASDEILQHGGEQEETVAAARGRKFADQWCDLQGEEWFPADPQDWRYRAPMFIVPGSKKAGTTSLASYLEQHPQILLGREKELHFFWDNKFDKFQNFDGVVRVKDARQEMYQNEYKATTLRDNPSLISFDATPQYLFESTITPRQILCVCPWVKVVIILRNPVDRAYSNYAYHMRHKQFQIDFEPYIELDFKLLKDTGVILEDLDKQKAFIGTREEDKAWKRYIDTKGKEGSISRGLYAIQIEHFFRAFQAAGLDPKTQFYFMRTEDMERDLDGEYRKVLNFLGLPYHQLEKRGVKVKSNYNSPMTAETRTMLEKFYEPHNQRLYELLGDTFSKW